MRGLSLIRSYGQNEGFETKGIPGITSVVSQNTDELQKKLGNLDFELIKPTSQRSRGH